MSEPTEKKTMPPTEWVISDMDGARRSILGMLGLRKMNREALAHRLGGRNLFSAFLSGKQKNLWLQSLVDAAEAMEFEVVVRPKRVDKMKARLAAVKRERAAETAVAQVEEPIIADDDPDFALKTRILDGMVGAENRAQIVQLFKDMKAS